MQLQWIKRGRNPSLSVFSYLTYAMSPTVIGSFGIVHGSSRRGLKNRRLLHRNWTQKGPKLSLAFAFSGDEFIRWTSSVGAWDSKKVSSLFSWACWTAEEMEGTSGTWSWRTQMSTNVRSFKLLWNTMYILWNSFHSIRLVCFYLFPNVEQWNGNSTHPLYWEIFSLLWRMPLLELTLFHVIKSALWSTRTALILYLTH